MKLTRWTKQLCWHYLIVWDGEKLNKNAKIFVAGHSGLLGSALMRRLEAHGYQNIVMKTHQELELTHQQAVMDFFADEKPEYVFLAAGKVGGIIANKSYRADFFHT
ncbi:NAD-dependent epimerase/dehydratase family protein, partial [Candidatus Roizmanbacteria bacterium]|nr:NAD-dependent epimerase/dehydratase family protein [Candidatus Roizmanbacteria bacterium]